MLRSSALAGVVSRQGRVLCHDGGVKTVTATRMVTRKTSCSSLMVSNRIRNATFTAVTKQQRSFFLQEQKQKQQLSLTVLRSLSSSSGEGAKKNDKATQKQGADGDDETTKELVLTPGEKVVVASRLTMWAGIFCLASVCAYYIGKELIPTKMSPNRVFDRAFDVVKNHPEIQRRYGDSLKAYGKDHGGHREGRRNFVENTQYTDETDGSKRTRVRFNLEGQLGHAFVFAEVSSDMPSGEFVYVLVQDKAGGRVQTLIDNRAALTAKRLAGGDAKGMAAMSQLLGGRKD